MSKSSPIIEELTERIEELENELERLKDTFKVRFSDLEYSLKYGELRKDILADAESYTNGRFNRGYYS